MPFTVRKKKSQAKKMPELGFHDLSSASARSSVIRSYHGSSPDSLIHNPSLFSSTSASVDRCSFASDAHDRDSLVSAILLQLPRSDDEHQESFSAPDPSPVLATPDKPSVRIRHRGISRKEDKVKVQEEGKGRPDSAELIGTQASATNPFTSALKECRERRSRSDALLKESDRNRLGLEDLNDTTGASPSFRINKSSTVAHRTDKFPCPERLTYHQTGAGMPKSWSPEHMPLHTAAGRKTVSTSLFPYNRKTIPSKWEDAERWILSPVSAEGAPRASLPRPQKQPKSKSGPLGRTGVGYSSPYSPRAPVFGGGSAKCFPAKSFLTPGALEEDGLTIQPHGRARTFPVQTELCMVRSNSMHGCSKILGQPSLPFQDEKSDEIKNASISVLHAASTRDVATQISPGSSTLSSPQMGNSCSASSSSTLPTVDVRDMLVDERVTLRTYSKKSKFKTPRNSANAINQKQKGESSAWDVPEVAKSISEMKREETRIAEWENLQKAKTEAAIRKLEVKLEKKRKSSMDKIMKKLRLAQKRAREMRSSLAARQANQVAQTSHKVLSFRSTCQLSSLSGCFTCRAF